MVGSPCPLLGLLLNGKRKGKVPESYSPIKMQPRNTVHPMRSLTPAIPTTCPRSTSGPRSSNKLPPLFDGRITHLPLPKQSTVMKALSEVLPLLWIHWPKVALMRTKRLKYTFPRWLFGVPSLEMVGRTKWLTWIW